MLLKLVGFTLQSAVSTSSTPTDYLRHVEVINREWHCLKEPATRFPAAQKRAKVRPNRSFNRSANGWPPGPRGASGSSCTARAWRPPVVARLTLR